MDKACLFGFSPRPACVQPQSIPCFLFPPVFKLSSVPLPNFFFSILSRFVPSDDAVHSLPHWRQINNSQLHRLNDSDSSLELTGTFTTSEELRITPAIAAAVSDPRDAAAAGAAAAGGAVGADGADGLSRPTAGGAGEGGRSDGDADVDDRYAVLHGLLLCRPWVIFQYMLRLFCELGVR